jgi:putative flippase GtrA
MPFTPFHLGPGAAIKAAMPRHFSLTLFSFTQVAIDCESLYYLVRREYPVHRFFHTYVGATLGAVACAILGRFLCQLGLRLFQSIAPRTFETYVADSPIIAWRTAFLTAFIGTYSHVFLDSIMHPDIRPFSPFSSSNPLFQSIGLGPLHLLCLVLGIVGFACLLTVSRPRD